MKKENDDTRLNAPFLNFNKPRQTLYVSGGNEDGVGKSMVATVVASL